MNKAIIHINEVMKLGNHRIFEFEFKNLKVNVLKYFLNNVERKKLQKFI
jgi:hypothetical protein